MDKFKFALEIIFIVVAVSILPVLGMLTAQASIEEDCKYTGTSYVGKWVLVCVEGK